jgi:hypothetical protein
MTTTYFANILLSNDLLTGRMKGPTRKKGDWYHSVAVFSNKSIYDLDVGDNTLCWVVHFYGDTGSPVLSSFKSVIKCDKIHNNKKIYCLDAWKYSFGVIGDIRTENGYEQGYGVTSMSVDVIIFSACGKWGDNKIPYAHQKNESYNCVGFVDDILCWAKDMKWNKRVDDCHAKYGLYIE